MTVRDYIVLGELERRKIFDEIRSLDEPDPEPAAANSKDHRDLFDYTIREFRRVDFENDTKARLTALSRRGQCDKFVELLTKKQDNYLLSK